MDRLRAKMIEEAHALAQQHMGDAHMEFIEQTRLQGLLDSACSMQGHIFLACQFLGFGHRALDALGDKVKVCVALLLWCSRL